MADEHEAYIKSSMAFHRKNPRKKHPHYSEGDYSENSEVSERSDYSDDGGNYLVDDYDDDDEVHVVTLDDEYKRQLSLGAVDTLANSLAFQNWLNATKYLTSKDSTNKKKKRIQRCWEIDTTSEQQEFIVSWKKMGCRRSKVKYDGYDSSDSEDDEGGDVVSSDDEEYDIPKYIINKESSNNNITIKLEYFTVATQSNISNTVKLVTDDLLKWLPVSAPTATKQFISRYKDKLLSADEQFFNALSITLMVAGALSSSSRSTTSNNPNKSNNNPKNARRWAHFAFPVNKNHDGFQYILVDTSPLDNKVRENNGNTDPTDFSLDVSLNSVVNATFAVSEKLVVHDMVTSVKTCLNKRGIPYEDGAKEEEEDDDWKDANASDTVKILCKQGLVPTTNGAPLPDNVPTAMTQFEFDQHGNLLDIGLSFG